MKINQIVAVSLLSLIFFSCSRDSDPNYYGTIKPKHASNEIWINNREEPQYLDPTLAHGVPDHQLALNTFYRLVSIDPETGKTVPELASHWDVTDGGKTYTFYMRKGLKWSDGIALTARDVEYSWKRLMDPATGSEYQGLASNIIENGDAFAQRSIQISGFTQKISTNDIKSFFTNHQVPIQKIQERNGTADVFVFVDGTTGEETQSNRQKILQILTNEHPWGGQIVAKLAAAEVTGVKALDDERLEVHLVGPIPYFLILVEFGNMAPLPQHVIEKFKAQGREDEWTKPENIVVSGPYKIKEEQFKQYKIYEKNPNYWDAANVHLNKVKVVMIEKETASLNSYRVGETDWIGPHLIPSEQIANVKNFKDYHNDPYLGMYYYIFNTTVKPLDDVKIRQALSLAIDRKAITEKVLGGGQISQTGLVPDGVSGYSNYKSEMYNPEKARQMLAEAGYPGGKSFPKLKFLYDTKEVHRLVIQAVQEMWKQNLGIDVDPVNVEWKIYLDRQKQMDFQIARFAWIGDFVDPYSFMEFLRSNSSNNHTGWKSSEYDRLLDLSNQELDSAKRFDLLRQAEKIAVDSTAYVPINVYTKTYMLKPYVSGFYPEYLDHHPWKFLKIDSNWKH